MTEELSRPEKKQKWLIPTRSDEKGLGPVVSYEVEAYSLDEAQELVAQGKGVLAAEPEEIDSGEPTGAYVNQDPDLR
tara:strand:+ start:9360 stop:9590 length:231 start_codon:yes stop_codon:yes gene_type:complete